MSRSSGEGVGSHDRVGGDRGQVEPLTALAAVFAVTAALALYTGALQGAMPKPRDSDLAPTVLDALVEEVSDHTGVVDPARLAAAHTDGTDGHRLNVTLTTRHRRWSIGPPTPRAAGDRAARRVALENSTNRTTIGRLRVVVW